MEPRKKRTLNTRSQSRDVIWVVQTQGAKRHSHGIITRARELQMPRRRRMEGGNLHRNRLRSRTAWHESSCKPHRTKDEWVGRAGPSVRTSDADNCACSCPWLSPKSQNLATIGDGDVDEQMGAGIGWNLPQVQREAPSSTTVTSAFPHIWGVRRSPGNSPIFWI